MPAVHTAVLHLGHVAMWQISVCFPKVLLKGAIALGGTMVTGLCHLPFR